MTPRGPRNPYLLEFLGAFDATIWERYRASAWAELCNAPEPEPEPEPEQAVAGLSMDLDALMGDIAGDLGEGDMHFAVTGQRSNGLGGDGRGVSEARVAAAAAATNAATAVPEGVPDNSKWDAGVGWLHRRSSHP